MQRKKEENNALQPHAWLICRINETTCFSRKPQEKCPKSVVVVFACLTETCAFWLGFSGSLSSIRGAEEGGIVAWFRLDLTMLSHAASVGSHFYQPLHPSVSF